MRPARGETRSAPIPSPSTRSGAFATARTALYITLFILASGVMFALMLTRHPPVYHALDHRHWYYPLPWLAILLFGVVIGLDRAMARMSRSGRRGVHAALALLVIGNLANLPHYRDLMVHGPWFGGVHPQSEKRFCAPASKTPTWPRTSATSAC